MKLIAQVKLLPDDEQRAYLLQTLEQANAFATGSVNRRGN